jgi:hypothetical protein
MRFLKFIVLIILCSASFLAEAQRAIFLSSEEKNLGNILNIPVLIQDVRKALENEGYILTGPTDHTYGLLLKISTRQGSESQGIYTSFVDAIITLKAPDGKILNEKSLIGLKGVGLNFEHAGIDAIKKLKDKVIKEVIYMLNAKQVKMPVVEGNPDITFYTERNADITPPEIILSEPLLIRNSSFETSHNIVRIEGKASDSSGIFILTINDRPIQVESSGRFSTEILVNEGLTQILILAEDKNHNKSSKVFSVSRTGVSTTIPLTDTEPAKIKSRYFALVIGINDYQDPGITSLDNPLKDAASLFDVLTTDYTFNPENVIFLKNPTRDKIIIALDQLSRRISKDDNLLIFYAGHGLWDAKRRLGYWLPADATISNTANWILNSTVKDMIAGIPSKHTLLIADACFSGSIFKTRKAFNDAPPSVEKLFELPSRKAMTSGTMTEVPDKSVFLEFLLKRLIDNKLPYLSSEQLFASFREAVMNNSPNTPQYGVIQETGDEGGDFIFIKNVLN